MKKLSLMLALLLVVSCALVACGDETEASSAPVTESSVADVESKEESKEESVEASTEESTEESTEVSTEDSTPADESSAPAPEAGTDNIAAGKTYTHSVLFRQGGDGHDPNAPIAYPDEDEKSLTDEVLPADDAAYGSVEWVGFNSNDPDYEGYHWITVDLGEKKNLAKFVFNYGTSVLGAGIAAPSTLEIYVSEDGTTWGDAVDGDVPEDGGSSVNGSLAIEAAAEGRYVQFRFTSGGWAFVSEVEVYAAAE